ncbi:hypothetical protein BDW72DRAFT_185770 [Aspergillus terricola var. indicus]
MHFSGTNSQTCSSSRGGYSEAAFIANLNGCRVLFYEQEGCIGPGRGGGSLESKSCGVPGAYENDDEDKDNDDDEDEGEDYDKRKLKSRLAKRGSPSSSKGQGNDGGEDGGRKGGDENGNTSAVIKSFKIICG